MKPILYIAALTAAFIGMFIYVMVSGSDLAGELGNILTAAEATGVKMVLVDMYIGFLILAGWFVYREGFGLKAILLTLGLFTLGNIVALIYILALLIKTRGDVWETLLGRRA